MEEKWYEKSITTVLFLIFFWPIGLYLMWKYRDLNRVAKILITILIISIHSIALGSR